MIAGTGLLPIIRFYGGVKLPPVTALLADLRPILAVGAPAILTQLATPVGQAWVTRSMAEFGEDAVAGMAIVGRLTPLAFAVIFALSGAVGPIIGQNYGAGNFDRVRQALNAAALFVALYIGFVAVLLFALRAPIAALFDADGVTRDLIYWFCGPLALAFFFNGLVFVANAACNNLGHALQSTWINWGRHTLGTIPFVIAGAWAFGAPGVLIGQAAGGVVFGVLAWVLVKRLVSNASLRSEAADPFAKEARAITLFHRRHH